MDYKQVGALIGVLTEISAELSDIGISLAGIEDALNERKGEAVG